MPADKSAAVCEFLNNPLRPLWLNQVEIWFSKIERDVITSVADHRT